MKKPFFRYNHTEFEPLLLRPAVGGAGDAPKTRQEC